MVRSILWNGRKYYGTGTSRLRYDYTRHQSNNTVSVHSPTIIPWEQLINPVDLVVSDAAQGIGEPGLRIDAVQLRGFNQCVDDGCGFAAPF
jgi:hypothetical protein